jgi:hypothetical protein
LQITQYHRRPVTLRQAAHFVGEHGCRLGILAFHRHGHGDMFDAGLLAALAPGRRLSQPQGDAIGHLVKPATYGGAAPDAIGSEHRQATGEEGDYCLAIEVQALG